MSPWKISGSVSSGVSAKAGKRASTRSWTRCQVCGVWPAATVKVRRAGRRLRRTRQKLATCGGCADMIEHCLVYWMTGLDVLDVYWATEGLRQ